MARLSETNLVVAHRIVGLYPRKRSALIPLCHLVQEQDGHLTQDGMAHVAELVGCTPAEVYGTATFYEMFKLEPVGKYLLGVCTNISCMLSGGEELLHHAEHKLGIAHGATTPDGTFTLEETECLAACTDAPCMQVNYRYFNRLTTDDFDTLIDDLRAGRLNDTVPVHGTLSRTRQHIPADRAATVTVPSESDPT